MLWVETSLLTLVHRNIPLSRSAPLRYDKDTLPISRRRMPNYIAEISSRFAIAALLCWSISGAKICADDARPNLKPTPSRAVSSEKPAGQELKTADRSNAANKRIQELIRQLGDPRYTSRRGAANELRQIGAEAFDLLHAATGDADPEVAASAQYLLRQIAVRWVESDDSAAVRRLLRDYDRQPTDVRLRTIEDLTELPEGEGIVALCRIARFDRSPLVSRAAALAIIRPADRHVSRPTIDPEVIERALAASTRAAANWLRQYVAQLRDPAAAVANWQQLIDEETARLEQNANETKSEIVFGLLWNLADVYRQLGDAHALVKVLDRMVALEADVLDETIVYLLEWLTEHGAWTVLDDFLAKHQARFEQSKRPLYYAAIGRARQGQRELAEELADKAAQLEPQVALQMAKDLEEHGQFEWAVREYRRAIEKPSQDLNEIYARMNLAALLHDHEQHEQAAEALEPLVIALRGEGRIAKVHSDIQQYYERRGGSGLPDVKTLACRVHYYRACQYRAAEDWQRTRDELKLAIEFDPMDADVLIAMYRIPDADAEWLETTRGRIRELCRQFQQKIDQEPHEPTNYNQWAWLVGNTEGDFHKAIRYSHRSLELNSDPESAAASYLDTLGRCYYAVGDYENALKYQRQAIEKIDYMQVMQRQLAMFEKALAEKQGAGSGEQGAGSGEQGTEKTD